MKSSKLVPSFWRRIQSITPLGITEELAVDYNLSSSQSDSDSIKSILDEELRIVENALKKNYKSYGAWHQCKWVLSKEHSNSDWELQLYICSRSKTPGIFMHGTTAGL